jgi:hypothetical protein
VRAEDDAQFDPVRPVRPWVAAAETLLLVMSVPLLGRWADPGDPLFARGPVSWSLLVPLVAGLRHGLLGGFGGAVALSAALIGCWRHPVLPVPVFPGPLVAALILVGMVSGQFAHHWASRARRIGILHAHQDRRFAEFARYYQVLKVSHDGLEEESAAARGNLRTALTALRAELIRVPEAASALRECGPLVLELFQAFGQVQAAALLPVAGTSVLASCASLGEVPDAVTTDPLVELALRTRHVASLSHLGNSDGVGMATALVAAVPLVDVAGRAWAVIAIKEMPFFALTGEVLRLFALLGGAIADALAFGATLKGDDLRSVERFERRVRRCRGDARRQGIPSALVVFAADAGGLGAEILTRILEQRRSLDEACLIDAGDGGRSLYLLLPLVDARGARGYLDRVTGVVERAAGVSLASAGVRAVHCLALAEEDPTAALAALRERAPEQGKRA